MVFKYHIIVTLRLSMSVKEFWESVNKWRSYGNNSVACYFLEHSVYV